MVLFTAEFPVFLTYGWITRTFIHKIIKDIIAIVQITDILLIYINEQTMPIRIAKVDIIENVDEYKFPIA